MRRSTSGSAIDIYAGHGITTVFGALFTSHAPAWPAIIALPHALFGTDPLAVGRFLDAVCGIAFVVLTGALGWRVRPIVGAISAAGLLALIYLHDLTRTSRLDVPAATLTLLYLYVAFIAFRRGSLRLGLVAGAVFAAGFLVKEIDLPFAPAPILAAILWGTSWRSIGRTAAALCRGGERRDRAVVPLLCREGASRLPPRRARVDPDSRSRSRSSSWSSWAWRPAGSRSRQSGPGSRPEPGGCGSDRRLRLLLGWGLTLLWAVLQTYAYAKTARLTGTTFLGLDQLRLYAATWFDALWVVGFFGLTGVALSIVALIVDRRLRRR